MKKIRHAAIVGMGALGLLYGEKILHHIGPEALSFVAEEDRIRKYQQMHFTVNGEPVCFPLQTAESASPADLVLVAVKGPALEAALQTMQALIGPDTILLSVMNGITSEEILGARYGKERILGCVAQGMDAVKFGGDLTYSKPGELRIGILPGGHPDKLKAVEEFLTRAQIAYTEEADIRFRLWGKFMLNVGINQTCMAYETNYGGALTPGEAYETLIGAMRETIQIANLEGIALTEQDLEGYVALIRTLSPTGCPSMRQDGIAHRHSEVELFSGTICRLAAKHGVSVPVNTRLYQTIRTMEESWEVPNA